MKERLLDFIVRQRSVLEAERLSLAERLLDLDRELKSLELAEAAINISESKLHESKINKEIYTNKKEGTIIENVIEILKVHRNGLIAIDILRELNSRRETPLARTSLSPQLSRMKSRGLVDLVGSNWVLKAETNEKGT